MATLTRVKTRAESEPLVDLDSQIPTPFPREQLVQQQDVEQDGQREASEASPSEVGPSITIEPPATTEAVTIVSTPCHFMIVVNHLSSERCHAFHLPRPKIMSNDFKQPSLWACRLAPHNPRPPTFNASICNSFLGRLVVDVSPPDPGDESS